MNNTTFFAKIGSVCLVFIFSIVSAFGQCEAPLGLTVTSIDQISARIDWSASVAPDVLQYESELRTSGSPLSGGAGLVASAQGIPTFVEYTDLIPNTTYFFYVRSKCAGNVNGAWSPALSFSTLAIIPPVAINPDDISSISFVARWEAVTGATQYLVEVATDLDWDEAEEEIVGNELNVLITDLTPLSTYYYRVSVRNGTSGPFSAPSNIITVQTTNIAPTVAIWSSTGWSAQPTESVDLEIRADFNTATSLYGSSLKGKSLTLFSPFKFTLAAGTFIIISENIVNLSGAANFVQESNSNLNQLLGTPNQGAITVHRNSFPIYRLDYTMWSSPVVGQNLFNFSPGTLANRFYSYNSATDQFITIPTPQSESFVPGKGYLIRAPNAWPEFSTFPGVRYDGKFVGIPTPGEVQVTLQPGYNMIGNPFPCDIAAGALINGNATAFYGTLYFWRRRNNAAGTGPTTSFYSTYTTSGGVGIIPDVGDPEIISTKPTSTIKVGQGFIVQTKVSDAQTTMTFTRTMKKNNNYGDVFLKTSEATNAIEEDGVERHKFYLNLTGGPGIGGQLLLAYAGDASDDLDDADGKYIGDSEIALTSIIADQSYVIQAKALPFASNDEIALRFQTSVAASYTIALEDVTGMFTENVDPLLVDMLTNTTTNLRNTSYSFASEIGIFDDRFKVVYEETALGTVDVAADVNAVVVMSKNNVLTIDAGSYAISSVEIYDMLGRKIYSKSNVDANSTIISDLRAQNQIILVQIGTDHGIVTKKVQF